MKPLKKFFESGPTILWIETQNTGAFLRPVPDILVWTPCPTAGVAQSLRFCQVRFTGSEGLLGSLAFLLCSFTLSDVDHSAHKFNEMAGRAQNGMRHDVNVPDGPIRMHDAIVRLPLRLLAGS